MTAQAHNAPQVGHYEFKPDSLEVRLFADNPDACQVFNTLLGACGFKVVWKPKKSKRKRARS